MRPCPHCRFQCPDEATECPSCGIVFARYRPAASRAGAPGGAAGRFGRGGVDDAPEGRAFTVPWGGLLALLLLLGVAGWWLKPTWMPVEALQPGSRTDASPCDGMPLCVVVYVAPWCPACKQSLPVIREVASTLQKSGEAGLMIVVGADSPENLRSMATTLGQGTFIDEGNAVKEALDVTVFPTWFTLSSSGRVIEKQPGTVMVAAAQIERLNIRD